MKGLNHQSMNDTNKYIILKALTTNGAMSRIDLSTISGLSKMTITAIINHYIEQDIIYECGVLNSSGGRKPKLVDIKNDALLTLSVYIGRRALQVGIVNTKGNVLCSESIPFESIQNSEVLLNNIFYLCDTVLGSGYIDKVWGIGVSCVGPLSISKGTILNPPNFNRIQNVAIVDALKQKYNLPCYLQNDMCVAALAENYFGNEKQYKNFLFVGISTGIGGGVIIDNHLYTGSNGLSGIVGHAIVEPGGIQCECGQVGCCEKYASVPAVLSWAKQYSKNDKLTWYDLINGLKNNDEVSVKAIDRMVYFLYIALTNFVMALDVQCIVIGGDLHTERDYIASKLFEKFEDSNLIWANSRTMDIIASKFITNASLVGNAALVMENNLDVK